MHIPIFFGRIHDIPYDFQKDITGNKISKSNWKIYATKYGFNTDKSGYESFNAACKEALMILDNVKYYSSIFDVEDWIGS